MENKEIILFWIYIIMVFSLYFIIGQTAWNFPKYHSISVPAIIILVIYFTPKRIINIKKIIPIISITLLLLLIYFIFVLGDPIMPEFEGRVVTSSFYFALKFILIRIFLYAFIPIFLCAGLFKKIPKKKLWIILFFLLIFSSIYINIIQARADYSTVNLYGDKGLNEVIDFMKETPPNEILTYHYIGYYLGYLGASELTTLIYHKPQLITLLESNKINWIIITEKDLLFLEERTFSEFELEKRIEDYNILKRIINS